MMGNLKDLQGGQNSPRKGFVLHTTKVTEHEHLGTEYDCLGQAAEDGPKVSLGHRDLEKKAMQ